MWLLITDHVSPKLIKRFGVGFFAIIILTILFQVLYPHNRAFIGAKLDGQNVAWQTKSEIESRINKQYQVARINIPELSLSASLKEAGISPDSDSASNQVIDYPIWQRLIPFSGIYKAFSTDKSTPAKVRPLTVRQWAESVVEVCNLPAVNASIEYRDEGLQVVPSKPGRSCNVDTVINQIKSTPISTNIKLDPKAKTINPTRGDAVATEQLKKIQTIVKQGITVKALDREQIAPAEMVASWLEFYDEANGAIGVRVKPDNMGSFISKLQQSVYIQPGVTYIETRDGAEISRVVGTSGRGINQDKLVKDINGVLTSYKNSLITAEVVTLAPKEVFNRSYTNSTAGLQALIQFLVKDKNMSISIYELDGQKRNVSAEGAKTYHPASTYKLVVAYSVIKRIENGQLKWDDSVEGKTVDACLTTMIVDSDNACGEAFGEKFGWGAVHADARSAGMSSTRLDITDFTSTTVDQVSFLVKLQEGKLMKTEHRDKLLELMKRQRYRAGIPAGVSGTVADKVGFLGGLLHDSAIVYSPSGTYVMSIYSSGGSWSAIANATREIELLRRQ